MDQGIRLFLLMNKFFIPILIFFSLPFGIFAQGEGTGMAKFRMGMAFPSGDFGRNDGSLQFNCFARQGLNIGYETAYFYSPNIGFGLLLSYNRNKIDENRLINAYINSNSQFDTAFVQIGSFKSFVGTVGLYFDFPATSYLSFTMKMMLGTFLVQKPQGTLNMRLSQGGASVIQQDETISSKFAIYTGAGMRLSPIEKWSITADIEYIGSRLTFTFKENGQEIDINSQVKLFVVSLGISYLIE